MRLHPLSPGDVFFRNPTETPEDYRCALCDELITDPLIWVCDDEELATANRRKVCNAFYFHAPCATDDMQIRQIIRETAAEYDADDPKQAEVLRQMAESALVRTVRRGRSKGETTKGK
jgi:hypothetical protein